MVQKSISQQTAVRKEEKTYRKKVLHPRPSQRGVLSSFWIIWKVFFEYFMLSVHRRSINLCASSHDFGSVRMSESHFRKYSKKIYPKNFASEWVWVFLLALIKKSQSDESETFSIYNSRMQIIYIVCVWATHVSRRWLCNLISLSISSTDFVLSGNSARFWEDVVCAKFILKYRGEKLLFTGWLPQRSILRILRISWGENFPLPCRLNHISSHNFESIDIQSGTIKMRLNAQFFYVSKSNINSGALRILESE